MATAPLDLKIAVVGVNKLDKLVKRMDVLEKEVERLNKTLPRAANNIKKVGTSSATAARQTSTFAKAVRGLGAAFATIQLGAGFNEAIRDARALQLAERRINLLTKEYSQFNGVQKEAERLAAKFEVSVADSSKALFSLGSRLGAQGATLTDIVSVYEGLNSALIVTGRSASEAAAVSYQLAQALGSGKLTGDELRTVSEALPELLNEIANQAGRSTKEIRQMAKDGLLTTEVIIKATAALRDKYSKAVAESITVNQKFQNAIQGVSERIGESLLPVIDPLQETLTKLLVTVIELPDPIIAIGTAAVTAAAGILALQGALLLLGLPGIIALFGKLAAALAAFSGVTATAVTGFTAAGAAIKTTTVAINAQTVALGALKGAMAATPWVAAAIAVGAVGYATYQTIDAVNEFNRVLRESPIAEIDKKIEELEKEMVKAENKTVSWTEQFIDFIFGVDGASTAVDGLANSIDRLNKRKIQLTDLRPDQGADLDMEAIKRLADIYDPIVTDKPTPTPTGGGGGGSAPRPSDAAQLKRDLDLAQKLFTLNSESLTAELKRNKLRLEGIQVTKVELETAKEIADINASDLYDEEKSLQIKIAQVKQAERLLAIESASAIEARDKAEAEAEAFRNTLRPLQEQRRILDATLNGRGEEERLLIDIENATKGLGVEQKALVEELIRGNAERVKEVLKLQQIEVFYDQISQTIQNGIVDGIMAAIDGSKELSEVLSGVLRTLGQMFLKQGVGMAFSGLGFADGGRPPMNQASVVGERGPELFVPDTAGTVLPNEAFAAARAALGGSGTNDSDDAFNENVSSINNTNTYLQQQAIATENQGIMRNSSGMLIQTQVINNVEYATIDQVAAASAASAKQARAQVFSDMKNRPAIRRQVGVK